LPGAVRCLGSPGVSPHWQRSPRHDQCYAAFELTTRGAGVLALVAGVLTDGEMAARLYFSPGTVGERVERILTRTGRANRAALAALRI
jgi:DNA-binding NarL/FixJ family response regulator